MVRRAAFLTFIAAAVALHVALLLPGFVAPSNFAEQDRERPFAPPTRLHFRDASGKFHVRPFIYAWKEDTDGLESGTYTEDTTEAYPVRLFVPGSEYSILGWQGFHTHLFGVDRPARLLLFGTDDYGRDVFSRMLYGGQISVLAGCLGTIVALSFATLLGIVSGFYGKWADGIVMRVAELFLALPWLYLLLGVRAALPLKVTTTQAFLLFVGIIGFVGWARPARMLRGIVLSAKERNFVQAARMLGASDIYILRRHILPQTYTTLLTLAALLIPQFILAEVTLSFLGLGVGEPLPSWGNMLGELQSYRVLTSYWWMYMPAAMLILLFLVYHRAATTLQERVPQALM